HGNIHLNIKKQRADPLQRVFHRGSLKALRSGHP
ncbi:MAG: hypothetical protein ACI9EH_000308, partial [Planktomarina sp.]